MAKKKRHNSRAVQEKDKLCNLNDFEKSLIRQIIEVVKTKKPEHLQLMIKKESLMNFFNNPNTEKELSEKTEELFMDFLMKASLCMELKDDDRSLYAKIIAGIDYDEGDLILSIDRIIKDEFIQSIILKYLDRDLTEEEKLEVMDYFDKLYFAKCDLVETPW